MNRFKMATALLACLILAVATLRAIAFWAADPLLAYANNSDQIRTLKVFGLHPKDSPSALYAMTPEQPYRYFIKADTLHIPNHPSSDLLFKVIQVSTMVALRDKDGVMDIRIATAPVLFTWLLGIWFIFYRLLPEQLAALSFATWVLLVTDPINLLFLNTWYAEFSAFALATLFVGLAWLWLFQRISLRRALLWGGMCLAVISFIRTQYMFLLPATAALVGIATLAIPRPYQRPTLVSAIKGTVLTAFCLLPMLMYHFAAQKEKEIAAWLATNRTNTIFGALLPASKDPAKTLEHMGLSPERCFRFSGKNLYVVPDTEFKAYCPESLTLPLVRIAKVVVLEPTILVMIIQNIAQHHNGFLQYHVGHIAGTDYGYLHNGSSTYFDGSAFRAVRDHAQISGSPVPLHLRSIDSLLTRMSAGTTMLIIWLTALGPALAALLAGFLRQKRWAFMFLLSGLLFNYILFSSILGDGYFELERHAFLCFSFGTLFFVLLGSFAASALRTKVGQQP